MLRRLEENDGDRLESSLRLVEGRTPANGWIAEFRALRENDGKRLEDGLRLVGGEQRDELSQGGLRLERGERQRTVGGRTSAREGRTAANCWRADFGTRGENSSELLESGLRPWGEG